MLFDYLLYDNRTVGPTGRDWGLKVATGALAGNRQIRQRFVEYCSRSFKTNVRIFRDFGAALGGFPTGSDSYLLCVTLEIRDLFRRPSCAFVGIHCTSRKALLSLLETADPTVTARAIYGTEGLLEQLGTQGKPWLDSGGPPEEPKLAVHESGSRFGPFQRGGSPRAAGFILARACRSGDRLPSILGIASWTSSKALVASPDQFIFYQYLPPALARQAKVQPAAAKEAPPPARPPAGGPAPARPKHFLWPFVMVIPLGILGLVMLFQLPQTTSPPEAPEPSVSPSSGSVSPPPSAPPAVSAKASSGSKVVSGPRPEAGRANFLDRMESLVMALDQLDPSGLKSSSIYKTLNEVKVLPKYTEKRAAMIQLIENELPSFQELALETVNIDYYFTSETKNKIPDPGRSSEVRKRLLGLQLPTEGCRLLRTAFAFWMSSPDSELASWCRVVEALSEERRALESRDSPHN